MIPFLLIKINTEILTMLDNFEYTFFDQQIAENFSAFITKQGFIANIRQEISPNDGYTFEVSVENTLNDKSIELIEDYYADLLFGEQASLIEGNSDQGAQADSCGVQVQLKSGIYTTIAIHPEIMNKILSVLTITELQSFLAKAAEDIEEPKTGPICSRNDLP